MRIVLLLIVVMLSGCVYTQHRATEASAFYNAQAQPKQPLFSLTAQPGETIELRGVASLTVNDPRAGEIKALPVVQSRAWSTIDRLIGAGAAYAGAKLSLDAIGEVSSLVANSAGDRSTHDDHSVHVADSYNDSSDNSTHGDTISGSYNTDQSAGDGSAIGDGNDLINGDNAGNSGQIGDGNRQNSDGPFDDHSDNSDPGDDCTDSNCATVPEDPEPGT